MAISSRDWWMLGIGAGISFFVFSTLGRRMALATMGLGKAEVERTVAKMERKAEERKVLPEEKTLFS